MSPPRPIRSTHWHCRSRFLATGLLLLATPGCAAGGFLAHLFGGGSAIKAEYTLENRSTAILVDDPERMLGAPALPGVVANNVRHALEKNAALETASIVSQDEVNRLASRLGDEFAVTPIDEIGRHLGADQVIHVEVQTASVYAFSGQVTRPRCSVRVKVIDVVNRKRLFPDTTAYVDSTFTPPGHLVQVEMEYKALDDGGSGQLTMLAQQLAQRTGRRVAELFYDHAAPEPGEMIK